MTSFAPPEQLSDLAAGRQAFPAIETTPAAGRERTDDSITDLKSLDRRAGLDDVTHELVSKYRSTIEACFPTVVDMEIGSTDGGHPSANDHVAVVGHERVWYRPQSNLLDALKGQCSHGLISLQGFGG